MPSALVVGTNTYIDLVTATALLDDSIHAAQWPFVDPDNQTRALLTALRLLDLRTWEGTKTDPLQALQWPRTGAIDRFGQPVDTATVPAQIEQAQAQLAYLLSQNPTLEDAGGTGSNEKRLQAGSAEIEYFRPTGGPNGEGSARFPPAVEELIREFLADGSGLLAPFASGTDEVSTFTDDARFGLVDGLV